jgi:hypothetical protein
MEELITFGSEVKALGNGKVGGYLVRFTDETTPDLAGDYFTKSTDFYLEPGDSRFVLYDHGFDKTLRRAKIGKGVLVKVDEVGLWIEAQLGVRDTYEKAVDKLQRKKLTDYAKGIYKLAEDGKLGWSSGAASHLAQRIEGKSANFLAEWGISEFSLTPRPCEPKNAVVALKTYSEIEAQPLDELVKTVQEPRLQDVGPRFGAQINALISDREENGQSRDLIVKSLAAAACLRTEDVTQIINSNERPTNAVIKAFARVLTVNYDLLKELADRGTPKTIKGLFAEELAERTPSTWELDSAMRCVIRKIAEAATASAEAGGEYDWKPKVSETMAEYTTRLTEMVTVQVQSWVDGDYDGDEFYLKSGIVTDGSLVTGGLDFEEHSELVVTAFREIVKRFRDNHEMRATKAGRVLSEKNRSRLSKLVDQMMSSVTECQSLLDETKPMASDVEKNAAYATYQRSRLQRQREQIGV